MASMWFATRHIIVLAEGGKLTTKNNIATLNIRGGMNNKIEEVR